MLKTYIREKRIPERLENQSRLVEEDQIYKKYQMFKDSIRIFQGLIAFIEGLITRKNIFFEVDSGFNQKKLKSGGQNAIFKS